MKRIIAGAVALVLSASFAVGQTNPGTSPLSIAKGGTSAATASAARTALGVAIGSAVEAWDSDLDCLAALAGTGILRRTGAGTCSNGTTVTVAEGGTGIGSGTSGGIPYFSSTSTVASSSLLAQYGVVIGGGAGAAPASVAACTSAQLLIGQATAPTCNTVSGDVTISNAGVTAIGANKVSNAMLAQMSAYTIKGNATGSTANATDISIPALTQKASPVAGDMLMIVDSAASNALKYATVSSIAVAGAVASVNGQTGAVVSYFAPQGRLTLQSGEPVMAVTRSAKTTIYYTPYVGNMVPIYDGTNMAPTAVAEISVATTDTTKNPAAIGASKVNDWFLWNDAGTIRLSHGPDWTNDTTRSAGTALVMVNGISLNNASITNGPAASRGTWVGTTRSNASSQLDWILGSAAAGGGMASLYVWNAYNQVYVATSVIDNTSSWSYTSATIGALNGSATNRVNFVSGAAVNSFDASITAMIRPAAVVTAFGQVGLALNSTTSFDIAARATNPSANTIDLTVSPRMSYAPPLGAHFVSANQNGDGANSTTYFGLSTYQREVLTFAASM